MRDVYFDPSLIFFPNSTKIRYEPLGVALIYGSWNFPYFVTLKPLANAIAAGNCAIIKPSEMSPKSSNIIQKIVQKYLDNDCYRVILGDVNVSIQIGKYPFDLICFTGSTEKGKLVAKVAAENLIPCILELGGKCPMIIDESADVDFAAMKVVAAKF
jgi:aldehyde dehydrogenase (NAD+)